MAVRTHQTPAPHPRQDRPGRALWLALSVLCVSILMVNLDNTVLNVALPTLVRDLHVGVGGVLRVGGRAHRRPGQHGNRGGADEH